MMRSDIDYYEPRPAPREVRDPYQSPPYIPPYSGGGDGEYFSDPYVTPTGGVGGLGGGVLDTGTEYPKVSRTGASYSIQPRANLRPGIPAGSLFSSRGYGRGPAFLSRVPYQRGFTVEGQERLRQRRRRWWERFL